MTQAAILRGIPVLALRRDQYCEISSYRNCRTVVHLAGLAHRRNNHPDDFEQINNQLTIKIARAAESAGVTRFILVSSSKALRDYASDETPINEDAELLPGCDYGRSKAAAEKSVLDIAREGKLECVILRPALIIGAPPKANLDALARLAEHQGKLAGQAILDGFSAKRSVTGLSNLIDALWTVCAHPNAKGEIFHVVEDHPISAGQLFYGLRNARRGLLSEEDIEAYVRRKPSQIRVICGKALAAPLYFLAPIAGRRQSLYAISKPLVLDGQKIQRSLGWRPSVSLDVEMLRVMSSLHQIGDDCRG